MMIPETTEVFFFSFFFAQQICKSPCLLPDDFTEAYPKQGILGDCWLLCACDMLLKSRYLLDRVNTKTQIQICYNILKMNIFVVQFSCDVEY